MKIVVASGKGGTGKTMVAANMARSIAGRVPVTLVDCDVEVPDLHLFLGSDPDISPVLTTVPVIDYELCTFCGDCGRFCRYGALAVLRDRVIIFEKMCHACGGCSIVCPEGAISETTHPIGRVEVSEPVPGMRLVSGVMDEGEVLAPKVIKEAKSAAAGEGTVIIDSSPGIACPVIEAMEGADFCVLVTESTPFGLHDLGLAADVAKELGIKAGVVINRSDGSDEDARELCMERGLPVLLTIPFEREIASIQNGGELICERLPGWKEKFSNLYESCIALAGEGI